MDMDILIESFGTLGVKSMGIYQSANEIVEKEVIF